MKHAAALAALALLAGCTFEAGDGFGTLRDVELSAHLEGGPAIPTDLGYEVELRALSVEVHHLVLQDVTGEAAPAGDGHAHGEEEPESTAGEGEAVALAGAAVEAELDALAGEPIEVDGFEPSRELPFGAIRRVMVELGAVRLEATVQGSGLGEPVTLEVTLPLEVLLTADTLRELDRDHAHDVSVAAEVELAPSLLDGVDFAALADGPALRWDDASAPGARSLVEALGEATLHVTFDGEEAHE